MQWKIFRLIFLLTGEPMKFRYPILVAVAFVLFLLFILNANAAPTNQILGNPISLAQTTTTESSHVFKAAPGVLNSLAVTSSAAGYAMLFNTTTAPANGTVAPVACYGVSAAGTTVISFYTYPLPFSTGITAVFSSTGCTTQTLSATAFFMAQYQ